jgi:cell division protein FtsN
MARKRRKHKQAKRKEEYPGWVWLVFGLTIGLSVAFAIYVNGLSRIPVVVAKQNTQQPALDNTSEKQNEVAVVVPAEPKDRFNFYSMLPNFEVIVPEQEPDVTKDVEPQAVVEPGVYILQAGSFTLLEDADRRRAELALQGIESRVQRVSIDENTFHRVRIGPLQDLDELNMVRSRLRQANIDVLRIRIGD